VKFREGQRVRLNRLVYEDLEKRLGRKVEGDVVGVISEYRVDVGWKFVPDNVGYRGWFGWWNVGEESLVALDDESPIVASPRKPRVGDKVRLTAKGLEYFRESWSEVTGDYYVGLVGQLTDVVEYRGTYDLWVEFFDVDHGKFSSVEGWAIQPEYIEFLADTPVDRVYPAPRDMTIVEALVGDDRPARNGEAFELTMLTHFDANDAERMLTLSATWALFPAQANQAIDVGLFAQRIKRRLEGQAA
jgi:hypothetical protein